MVRESAQFNMIVSGIPLRETPDTIFNVELNRFAVVLFCPEKPGLLGQDSFLLFFEN
jgi:hypothetical protein